MFGLLFLLYEKVKLNEREMKSKGNESKVLSDEFEIVYLLDCGVVLMNNVLMLYLNLLCKKVMLGCICD